MIICNQSMKNIGNRVEGVFELSPGKFIIWVAIFTSILSILYVFMDNLERNQHIVADQYEEAKKISDTHCREVSSIRQINDVCENAHVVLERSNRTTAIAMTLRGYFSFNDTEKFALYMSVFWDKMILSVFFLVTVGIISTMICGCSVLTATGKRDYYVPTYRTELETKKVM